MVKIRLIQAHVLAGLAMLQNESVQMVCTSPPYWGLRDYGLEPQVWGGEAGCGHEWGDLQKSPWADHVPGPSGRQKNSIAGHWKPKQTGPFCRLCEAWRGSFGLEPVLDCLGWATGAPCGQCYVCHTVQIFREVRRVLRKDGTLWLNLGDSYNGSGGAGGDYNTGGLKEGQPRYPGRKAPGLKRKDLCMVPARVALALQADGWWLRSDIIWSKPNAMTESCSDRPTKSHETIFQLTKSAHYFWDQEAVKECCHSGPSDIRKMEESKERIGGFYKDNESLLDKASKHTNIGRKRAVGSPNGRNLRSVWTIVTGRRITAVALFPEAHFATFPPALPERCIKAGTSEKGCCPQCGAPWKRVLEKEIKRHEKWFGESASVRHDRGKAGAGYNEVVSLTTICWTHTCKCNTGEPIPCTVLDPFAGTGTTGLVAGKLCRDAVLIELKPEYCRMAEKRLKKELGMLAEISIDLNPRAAI